MPVNSMLTSVFMSIQGGLANAVFCQVPLLDMLRFHKLLAGASWMAEYGDPDVEEEREFLASYSPYHNVSETTGDDVGVGGYVPAAAVKRPGRPEQRC